MTGTPEEPRSDEDLTTVPAGDSSQDLGGGDATATEGAAAGLTSQPDPGDEPDPVRPADR